MSELDLLVHDAREDFSVGRRTLRLLDDWRADQAAGAAPFPLTPDVQVGIRLGGEVDPWFAERFFRLDAAARGLRACAARVARGEVAVLRSVTENPAVYVVLSAGAPVTCALVTQGMPEDRPLPYPEAEAAGFLAFVAENAPRWLASCGDPSLDRAHGRHLRMDRSALIRDLAHAADLAEAVHAGLAPV